MDSVLLTAMVSAMCSGAGSSYKDACYNAIEATAKESGVYERVKKEEKKREKKLKRSAKEIVGRKNLEMISSTLLLIGVGSGRSVLFKLGEGRYKETYFLRGSKDEAILGLGWNF